jgi:4-hydroxy-3-methylbut-2-enyl diphosphate reductase
MKILIAKSSGFCMGVRRAVEMVLDASAEHKDPILTYGQLIHNPQVLKVLEEKGIQVLQEVPEHGSGTVLIRAHGVPPQTKQRLKKAGFNIIDATCPRVIKIQTIIKKYAKRDHAVIIVGDENHPEVIGLLGYAGQRGFNVNNLEQLAALPAFDKAIIVAQTTQNTRLFQSVKAWAQRCHPHYKVFETICDSTERRQAEVKRLSESVDAVIVVGGRNSGNTRRLTEIAKASGKPAFHIETETDLESIDLDSLAAARYIGLTAGASTPNWIIKKIYRALEQLPYQHKRGWRLGLFSVQRALLLTNTYVALGAGLLTYACTRLQGIPDYFAFIFISILYVQSMHTLNHLTGTQADAYNDPDRADFYRKHRRLLALLAIIAGGGAILTAYTLGNLPFFLLLAMSMLGLSYNLRLVPPSLRGITYCRIRDIPGSKTILITMAWGILAAVIPPLSVNGKITWLNGLMFGWAAALVFARTAFFDILDMQGDRIIGKETLALFMGEKGMLRLLVALLFLLIVLLISFGAFQLIHPLGIALVLCPTFILMTLWSYIKGYLLPGIRLEFLVESNFVIAGIITFIGS